jgi:hypothetical protein
MKTYTVFGYDLPSGGHRVETVDADSPTEAAIELGRKHELAQHEWEIIGVVEGEVQCCPLDHTALNLAPFAPQLV